VRSLRDRLFTQTLVVRALLARRVSAWPGGSFVRRRNDAHAPTSEFRGRMLRKVPGGIVFLNAMLALTPAVPYAACRRLSPPAFAAQLPQGASYTGRYTRALKSRCRSPFTVNLDDAA